MAVSFIDTYLKIQFYRIRQIDSSIVSKIISDPYINEAYLFRQSGIGLFANIILKM